jgi:GPH family glycoside/pentoside/hexuronide:cation symporter
MNSLNENLNSLETKETSTLKMGMFSMGYFTSVFIMMAFNSYVWTFYEGELGLISIVPLWPIYLVIGNVVYTLWSMVVNPLIAFLTDKPFKWTKKRGFHTPWVIIGGIPTIIFLFLLFTPPQMTGVESAIPILIYYIIIVCIYDTFYSLFQTHSFGAFGAHFRGDEARRKAGFLTQIFTFISNFLVIAIWSQIVETENPTSFTIAAFISVIILLISLAIFYPGSKESEEIKDRFIFGYKNAEKASFFKTMKIAVKQKNFMLAIFIYILFMIGFGLLSMNSFYYVDDVLQAEQEIRVIESIILLCASLLTMPIWIRVAKKIGHSTIFSLGLVTYGVAVLFNLFITDVFQFYILAIFKGIAMPMFLIMLSPIFADCYDEIAVKMKKHQQTTLIGVRNFFVKINVTIQSVIIASVHLLTAYDPANPNSESLIGLRIIQGLLPFIFCIIGALVFYKWYDLKGEKKQEIMQKLHEMGL